MQCSTCIITKLFCASFDNNDHFPFLVDFCVPLFKINDYIDMFKIIFNQFFSFQQLFEVMSFWLRLYYAFIILVLLEKCISCFTPLNPFLTKLPFKWHLSFLFSLYLFLLKPFRFAHNLFSQSTQYSPCGKLVSFLCIST